jgi:hypothetical protein
MDDAQALTLWETNKFAPLTDDTLGVLEEGIRDLVNVSASTKPKVRVFATCLQR